MRKSTWRSRVAIILSLGLMLGLLHITDATAAKRPTVPGTVAVELGDVARVNIKPNGYKIKKVTAVASNSNVGILSTTKKSIIINGISEGDAKLVITIKAKKKKKTHTFSLITSVMVIKMEGQGGDPTPSPNSTIAPNATQSPNPVVSGSPAPNVTPTPMTTGTPVPATTSVPGATSTPQPLNPTTSPTAVPSTHELRVLVTCKTGLRDVDVSVPITQSLLEEKIIDTIELFDEFDKRVGLDMVKKYEYKAFHDSACKKPYDEGTCLEGGVSYIQVKVIIADEYRGRYADSIGIGRLELSRDAAG